MLERRVILSLASVVILLAAAPVSAQSNAEVQAGTQFNFSTPGARSLALGGAFLGLADDATAAFANPAGLTILTRPEVSVEGRNWKFTSEFTDRGRGFGNPTGIGVDTEENLLLGSESSDTSGISFLSFVYPRERWAIAVYRHELANFETAYLTQGAFFDSVNEMGAAVPTRAFPAAARLELLIEGVGASVAFQLSDAISVGAGVAHYDFELDAITGRFALDQSPGRLTAPGGFFGPPDYSTNNLLNAQLEQGDDDDVGFNLGFLWRFAERWSVGGVFRQGPEFEYRAANLPGPAAGPGFIAAEQSARFNVPDVYGLGVSFRPTDAMLFTFDYNRVTYSDLTESTINVFHDPENPSGDAQRAAARRLAIDDADELHLGFEYVAFRARFPVAFRLGAWHDPDHRIAFEGQPNRSQEERALATLFRSGDDEVHYSAGVGLVFGQRFQLDAAYSTSDSIDMGSLSAVYRF